MFLQWRRSLAPDRPSGHPYLAIRTSQHAGQTASAIRRIFRWTNWLPDLVKPCRSASWVCRAGNGKHFIPLISEKLGQEPSRSRRRMFCCQFCPDAAKSVHPGADIGTVMVCIT